MTEPNAKTKREMKAKEFLIWYSTLPCSVVELIEMIEHIHSVLGRYD